MVIDSSAVIAWIRAEPEADAIERAILEAPLLLMSAFNAFETQTVLLRRFPGSGLRTFEVFLED